MENNYFDILVKHFSKDTCGGQIQILLEELSELQVALHHLERGRTGSYKEVVEEMAHVYISLSVVSSKLGINREDILKECERKCKKYKL